MTKVTYVETKHKTYTVPVGQCALHTSVYVPNFVDVHHNASLCLGESNKKEEPSKISDNNKNDYVLFLVHLPYFFHKATIIHVFFHTWHKHCIIWVMNLRHNISSGVIKSLFLSFIINVECNSSVIFVWDSTEKNEIIIHYRIQEWHTFPTYDILQNQSNDPTVCLLLDMALQADHCITVCGKWIFDSNLKLAFHSRVLG